MLSPNELTEIRMAVQAEVADIEHHIHYDQHGTYTHLCAIAGELVWTHSPVGRVLYEFPPHTPEDDAA